MARFDNTGAEIMKAAVLILLGTSLVVLTTAPQKDAPSPVAELQPE